MSIRLNDDLRKRHSVQMRDKKEREMHIQLVNLMIHFCMYCANRYMCTLGLKITDTTFE